MIKKIGNKMKNAAGAPLEYFKPDESGCLLKDALAAGFKAMKVVLGESLMQNLQCILFPGDEKEVQLKELEAVFAPYLEEVPNDDDVDQDSGNPDNVIHSETFNKFIEEDIGLDSEDLAILRELCGFSDEV